MGDACGATADRREIEVKKEGVDHLWTPFTLLTHHDVWGTIRGLWGGDQVGRGK